MLDIIKNLPVSNRFGGGSHTYTLYCEDSMTGEQLKYEVFADSFDNALYSISVFFNTPYTYRVINNNEAELALGNYPNTTCRLYL